MTAHTAGKGEGRRPLAFSAAVDLSSTDLREAQRGALHAVAAHRASSNAPAQLVLPTGVGKTLIATLLPYILEAERALVVTPARIIRDQVAHSFRTLHTAKQFGVLSPKTTAPATIRADHRCTADFWASCADLDVVIGTPQVLSHGYSGVAEIPEGLFDLVIFDEAHHLPAPTWSTLHAHLSKVPTALLTATPFRADQKRLPGEIAFAYPLSRAIEQNVYQPVTFLPVSMNAAEDRDVILAKKVAERLGLPHHAEASSRALVRTNRKEHAEELIATYAAQGVRLAEVLDRTSGRTVRKRLKELDAGELDGLVVVGAMTEGFDFPRMKVAAYHQPHKTLAPTLQFVGRLARTGDVQGELIAFPEDVSGETSELFREDAAWEKLLPDIVDSAVDSERRVRHFTSGLTHLPLSEHRVSALALAPPRATHIFRVPTKPDFSFDPVALGKGDVIERFHHPQDDLVAYITRHRLHPRFMREDILDSVEYQLHIATWVEDPGLLFICTDAPTALKALRRELAGGAATPIGATDLARLLAAADLERCFSVGARAASAGSAANESYRTLAGPRAEQSLSPSDARTRVLGHVMGRMSGTGAGSGTFGFSSKKAKLWEPAATDSLLEFREWCVGHAEVLRASQAPAAKDTPLKYLSLPDQLRTYPDAPAIAILPPSALADDRDFHIDGQVADPLATDVFCNHLSASAVEICLAYDGKECKLKLEVDGSISIESGQCMFVDGSTGEIETVDEFLEENPVTLLFGDGSWVFGEQIVRPSAAVMPLATEARQPLDWTGVTTSVEFAEPLTDTNCVAGKSIALLKTEKDWIIQDHLRGELADFVCAQTAGSRVGIDLVHCKASGGNAPSTRVTDVQELIAQALRSMYLATAGSAIWKELAKRINNRAATQVVKGVEADVLNQIEGWAGDLPLIDWTITVVQPGVADEQLDAWEQGNALMVAAYDACNAQGVRLRLIDSQP